MMIRKVIAMLLCIMIIAPPLTAVSGTVVIPGFQPTVKIPIPLPPLPVTTLPIPKGPVNIPGMYSINTDTTTNQMVITQQTSRIVLDWRQFNIGANASVYFSQKDKNGNPMTDWAALNRIWDVNPTLIYGSLKADGRVYLINQNGIVFGPSSKVDIYALIASSLNLKSTDFFTNILNFNTARNEINGAAFYDDSKTPGSVENYGDITTKDQGSAFLIGPNVVNGGMISANMGQIGLVAGYDVMLDQPLTADNQTVIYPGSNPTTSETRTALVIKMKKSPNGARAWNMDGAALAADQGQVGMYGGIVNQDGLIRAVTAVQRAGHVELMASDKITTGVNSWIATPVSTSSEKFSSVPTLQSTIVFSGLDSSRPWDPQVYPSAIEHHGRIDSPRGICADQCSGQGLY